MAKKVLSLGQCAADNWSITQLLQRTFNADVVDVDTSEEALDRLKAESFDLVLVNRIFDANGDSGQSFIRALKQEAHKSVPVMLVSNFSDAQQKAVAAGALPGFGKSALNDPKTLALLTPLLG